MRSAIIIIGSEITSGSSRDTNSSYIARKLTQNGLDCRAIIAVSDNIGDIRDAIKGFLNDDIDLIVTTGGLGSTHDDVTRDALAEAFDLGLAENKDLIKRLSGHMPKGADIDLFMRQALLPNGASPILLDRGTAPGIMIKDNNNSIVISLPGVPKEMEDMLEVALEKIRSENDHKSLIREGSLNIFGLSEPELAKKIEPILHLFDDIEFTILAEIEKIRIIYSKLSDDPIDNERVTSARDKLIRLLDDNVFSEGTKTMQEVVAGYLIDQGLTLSTAESCTGGLISKMITDVTGSSGFYLGGVTAYRNDIKANILNVSHETLRKYGAVSQETALQMCAGVKQATKSEIAVAVTGIAGPSSDDSNKPVGLVYVCICDSNGSDVQEYMFSGSRDQVRRKTAQTALDMLRLHIKR